MNNEIKVVTIGGGTGLSVLLRGLKNYPLDITALVTVADDGGSSGKIRSDMNIPSPGDIRNVIAALSDVEPHLEKMFQYRFDIGEISGHPVGNLMIAAMADIHGDFSTAVKIMSKIFNVKGTVLPTTNDIATLNAVMKDNTIVRGESTITEYGGVIDRVYITPKTVKTTDYVLKAIEEADYIIMGPGSLYTSIIPNLVIGNIAEKIKNSKARKIYVANVMTQNGETDNYKVSDHIKAINKHIGENIFDLVIANSKDIEENVLKFYKLSKQDKVILDYEEVKNLGIEISSDEDVIKIEKNIVRHNTEKVSELIYEYILDNQESIVYKG
ncbi:MULTISPECIES: YvcK family protein [unclassified Gemella]|uniref:gluconeogenesis factor YvcK family protein n=1 Tax=unclassified Gemella TaxID=2624949 RepID=UPI001C04D5E3|nr:MULTISPECIES: YvcK family protein [unclassified Gemella]MBU0278947.1 YvcK family protein [Gemella sp. zg-1178]QWQ39056.1 YvcK family protein [Gemella sp. zg-570]